MTNDRAGVYAGPVALFMVTAGQTDVQATCHLRRRPIPGKHLLSGNVKLKEPTTLTHLESFIMPLIETQVQTTVPSNGATDVAHWPVTVPPMDEFNRKLVANAHPPQYENPRAEGRYNLVVIGAGTAGLIGSIATAGMGGKSALIERHLLGGDCLNWGCVPSKAIIRSARVMGELRKAAELDIHVPDGVEVDFGAVMARMRSLRADISHDDSMARLQREGVEVFLGEARFTGPDTVEVFDGQERQTLRFAKALIATGGRARDLPVPGLAEAGYLTNETLFQLTEQPRRLAVIGGGPIGAEMAQTFARLGTDVTIFIRDDSFLPKEDREAAAIVEAAFRRDGVEFICGADLQGVTLSETGKVLHYQQEGQPGQLEVDAILVSIGRVPNVEGLGLEAAGVAYTPQGVTVDDTLRTSNPRIYAAGDVAVKYQFTHMADAAARIVLQNALFPGPKKKLSNLVIPWTTYTAPEVAHVGRYTHELDAAGVAYEVFHKSLSEVDRARTDGETEGFVKVLVKQGSDQILGATIVASEAGEMINEITLAMVAGLGLKTLSTVIHPYPVQSEAIKKIADGYNRTRLTPTVKRVFETWLSWTRR
jgi:pyruvate/2-oxoglutarate dehydrogenase complex dihydrolipoamide dehydrogenase (E3) component